MRQLRTSGSVGAGGITTLGYPTNHFDLVKDGSKLNVYVKYSPKSFPKFGGE